jgi:hypothetical protein
MAVPDRESRERFLDMQERLRSRAHGHPRPRCRRRPWSWAPAAVADARGRRVAVIAVAIGGVGSSGRRRPELWVFVSTSSCLQVVLALGRR